MTQEDILTGVLLEEAALTLDELARACAVEPHWIIERIEAGFLRGAPTEPVACMRFTSVELVRAQRLAATERDFDANPELAALVVDLIEEVERLRARLKAAGLKVD